MQRTKRTHGIRSGAEGRATVRSDTDGQRVAFAALLLSLPRVLRPPYRLLLLAAALPFIAPSGGLSAQDAPRPALRVGRLAGAVSTRVRMNVSPDLQLNSYLQYDNETRRFGTNSRVWWTFSPVGDLFLVYNENVNALRDVLDRRRGWGFGSNQLLVKVQYAFRY